MNSNAKQKIIERLTLLANDLIDPVNGTKYDRPRQIGDLFTMTEDGWNEFYALSKRLLDNEKWATKFSEKYVAGKLIDILHDAVLPDPASVVIRGFEQLADEFENFNQERVVFVPLAGVKMHMAQLPIGRFILRNVVGEESERLTNRVRSIIMQTDHPLEQKESFYKLVFDERLAHVRGRPCFEFVVVAESGRAKELAEEETRRILDLLRFSIPFLHDDEKETIPFRYDERNVMIGLQGEIGEQGRHTATIDSADMNVIVSGEMVYHSLEITPKAVETMRRIGVFDVADILTKPTSQTSDFESAILRAVHWVASAQAQTEKENSLLNLITCLETFLTPKDRDAISSSIAEGVAILIGKGLEKRKQIKSRIKDFYKLRSALSHGGKDKILAADVKELRRIVGDLTVQLIRRRNEFQSVHSLLDWLEDQKLGGG